MSHEIDSGEHTPALRDTIQRAVHSATCPGCIAGVGGCAGVDEADEEITTAVLEALRSTREDLGYLRWCEWPGCLASYSAATGPRDRGWILVKAVVGLVLCPDHASAGHLPGRVWERKRLVGTCSCGARFVLHLSSQESPVTWWTSHVASRTEETGGGTG